MKYLIWSHRKNMWWGPNREGYVPDIARAGRYSELQATNIIFNALPGANIPVDEKLVQNFDGLVLDDVVKKLDSIRRM